MEIVSHALMGSIVASPFLATHPVGAAALALGSTLPDLDVLSRLLGRRAFLSCHQTVTHSLPLIVAVSAAIAFVHREAGLGLFAGLLLHTLTDVTNTYGIMLLAPFSRRRFCLEWVFFIDAFVLMITLPAAAALAWSVAQGSFPGPAIPVVWGTVVLAYWAGKAWLRHRARSLAPGGTIALIPSALWPFRFLGTARRGAGVRTFRMSALTGRLGDVEDHQVLDEEYRTDLAAVPEFRTMRELSPAFHAISVEPDGAGTLLLCRDLRTRNFSTRFGDLDIRFDAAGHLCGKKFHV